MKKDSHARMGHPIMKKAVIDAKDQHIEYLEDELLEKEKRIASEKFLAKVAEERERQAKISLENAKMVLLEERRTAEERRMRYAQGLTCSPAFGGPVYAGSNGWSV